MSRIFILLLITAQIAAAEWRVDSIATKASATPGLVHRHLEMEESETGDRAVVDLALFTNRTCRLRVIDNAGGGSDLAEAMQKKNCLAGVNGGYFDPNFAPLGLRIVDGKTTARLTHGRLMTGVIASDNVTRLFRVGEFSARRKWSTALECGPFLVDLAKSVRGLEATRTARRTFVAVGSNDRAAIGYCSSATLAGLSLILATPLGDFKIQRALNLDGGSSSAFWFKRENGSAFSISESKTVRDFVGIIPR